MVYISELNLDGLHSELVDNLGKDYSTEEIVNIILPRMFTRNIVDSFNNRIINITNINSIIHLLDFLNIDVDVCRTFILK